LGAIGGSSVKECVNRILRHILSNATARYINWKGRGGKLPFSEMVLSSVIASMCSVAISVIVFDIFKCFGLSHECDRQADILIANATLNCVAHMKRN